MLNSYANNNFKFDLNAVSGTLRKSHPKSRFIVRAVDKDTCIFDYKKPSVFYNTEEIVVLQIMLTGDNKCLIEYVNKSDFEEG